MEIVIVDIILPIVAFDAVQSFENRTSEIKEMILFNGKLRCHRTR
jgi:hypothetical protein